MSVEVGVGDCGSDGTGCRADVASPDGRRYGIWAAARAVSHAGNTVPVSHGAELGGGRGTGAECFPAGLPGASELRADGEDFELAVLHRLAAGAELAARYAAAGRAREPGLGGAG